MHQYLRGSRSIAHRMRVYAFLVALVPQGGLPGRGSPFLLSSVSCERATTTGQRAWRITESETLPINALSRVSGQPFDIDQVQFAIGAVCQADSRVGGEVRIFRAVGGQQDSSKSGVHLRLLLRVCSSSCSACEQAIKA